VPVLSSQDPLPDYRPGMEYGSADLDFWGPEP